MKIKWNDDDQKYAKLGITAFIVVVLCILANQALHQLPILTVGVGKLLDCLSPIAYGLVMAYLLTPLLKFFEKGAYWLCRRLFKKTGIHHKRIIRAVCVVLTWGITILMVAILLKLIIPELAASINGIISSMPSYVKKLTEWVSALFRDNPEIRQKLIEQIQALYTDLNSIIDFVVNSVAGIAPNVTEFLTNLTGGVFSAVSAAFNVVIGVIVSIYVLGAKERFVSQAKKLVYGVFSAKNANRITALARSTNKKFGGFFLGKIIDSIIVGVLCFILLSIFKIPYSVLISFVIGATNIIPFFGPIIGAIPCGIILILASPIKCLYFVIIVIALQQFDGNILGPKILGSSIGISSFWVMFAILVFGGMFGFWGLLCGVPLMAVIYEVVSHWVNTRLKAKKISANTADYLTVSHVDEETGELINLKEKDEQDATEN